MAELREKFVSCQVGVDDDATVAATKALNE